MKQTIEQWLAGITEEDWARLPSIAASVKAAEHWSDTKFVARLMQQYSDVREFCLLPLIDMPLHTDGSIYAHVLVLSRWRLAIGK